MPFYLHISFNLEAKRAIESKGISGQSINGLYQTYYYKLGGKKFTYDGEKTLYIVGSLPKNKLEFTVVLEESIVKQFVSLSFTSLL